jgi:hypothetical protein
LALDTGLEGFQIVGVALNSAMPWQAKDLEAETERKKAAAGVYVQRSTTSVTICLSDRLTGKLVFRSLNGSNQSLDETVVALGVVELLRSSLLETRLFAKKSTTTSDSSTAAIAVLLPEPVVAEASHSWWLLAGGGAMMGSGDLGIASQLSLGVGWRSPRTLGINIVASLPVFSPQISTERGTTELGLTGLSADVTASFFTHKRLRPFVGAFATLWRFGAEGQAVFPWESQSQSHFGASAGGIVGGAFSISSQLWLLASARAGGMARSPRVVFAQDVVGTWGSFAAQGDLALALKWP